MRTADIPVLLYHALTEAPQLGLGPVHVPARAFEEQMGWLAREGYHAILPAELVESLAGRRGLEARSVLVTFDDGFRSCLRLAAPALARHGFAAALFLATDAVGRASHQELPGFRGSALPAGDPPLGWEEVAALARAGWEIEAHGCSHVSLCDLSGETLRHEIEGSRTAIEQRLGRPVQFFAYPFGDWDRRVLAAVRAAGYSAAFGARGGRAGASVPPYRLPRIRIDPGDDLAVFARKVETGYASGRDRLRSRVRDALLASAAGRRVVRAIAGRRGR